MNKFYLRGALVLVWVLSACSAPTPTLAPTASPVQITLPTAAPTLTPQPTIATASEGETVTTASGLQYIEEVAGTGPQAEAGMLVSVHYTGTLESGEVFDASYQRGEPFQFMLGAGRVIAGWDEGIALMKVGGRARLIIPSELGYGAQGAGSIPPNATLIFDVALMAAEPLPTPLAVNEADYTTTASGLQYYDIVVGAGALPTNGQQVTVNYAGWFTDGRLLDASILHGGPIELAVGAGQVIPGWDEALSTMHVGGKRQVVIPPALAYGEAGYGDVIPPNTTLIFQMELVAIK